MDTVHEEDNGYRDSKKVGFHSHRQEKCIEIPSDSDEESELKVRSSPHTNHYHNDREHFLHLAVPQINLPPNSDTTICCKDEERRGSSASSSRRPSAIIAALRRPSQAVALSAAHAVMNQRRYIMGLFQDHSDENLSDGKENVNTKERIEKRTNRKLGDDALTIILSALYAKLLVVLGVAFPITEVISDEVRPFFYDGYYLYLYIGSILFMSYMYGSLVKEKAVTVIINSYHKNDDMMSATPTKKGINHVARYGSFYLRLGAIAFGIGSMVYSGLEFGRYFEMTNSAGCQSEALQAITPATRMLLTLFQIQFIFLNSKNVKFGKHRIISRFGLMHMIATNLCEWFNVLVEETEHEIIHLGVAEKNETTNATLQKRYCQEGRVMGSLVTDASPFLFPCTIEYSLICAVILFEMWKHIEPECDKTNGKFENKNKNKNNSKHQRKSQDRYKTQYNFNPLTNNPVNSNHHFTIDCSNAHRGLFAGIVVIVLTIISLIMFFVLADETGGRTAMAEIEVNVVELVVYIVTSIGVLVAMLRLRNLKYEKKVDSSEHSGIALDCILLVVAQTGMFIYSMFSIIGCYFTSTQSSAVSLLADIFSFIQTCLQTIFILDGWWRRCRSIEQAKRKPGREIITFLIVANMAMWAINTLEKNRAEFRPTHLKFFGHWAWTIITHISMPLAIFYRFHSTICLFEIWKSAYKIKTKFKNPILL